MHLGLFDPDPTLPADYWRRLAAQTDRVEVEIGPGDCGYLVRAARAAPRTLFVGIEVRRAVVERVRRDVELPANVRLLLGDDRWIVSHVLARASINALHVYFPDPWWKKRHHKRRLWTADFVRGVVRCLTADGRLYLATDVEPAFVGAASALEAGGLRRTGELREREVGGAYERKYAGQGRRVYEDAFAVDGRRGDAGEG